MTKTKKNIAIIIEVLLMISIIFAVLSMFFKVIILNKNTYADILDRNNVYGQVKESIYNKIDSVLSAKNINYDIKESIITEDDMKREADSAITGIIEYLETGENNIKPVDTQIYKQRVADILHSTIGNIVKPANKEVSFNDNLNAHNTECIVSKPQINEMVIVKKKAQVGQDVLEVEKLMTKDEAEARVKELLKQKGLTEEQAIKKATEKGITEEQALKILAGYGITIDNQPEENGSEKETSDDNKSNAEDNGTSSIQNNDNTTGNYANKAASNNKEDVSTVDKSANSNISPKSQLDMLENKLLDEANSSIEKEVEKMNLNKILESSKFKKIAEVTSIIYKLFWLFMILPIIFMAILIKMNGKNLINGLKQIGIAFLSVGLILSATFFSINFFKVYEKININPAYLKETAFYVIKHFSMVLSMYGIITFAIGLLLFIPVALKKWKRSKEPLLIK
jgi:hypothetical protein